MSKEIWVNIATDVSFTYFPLNIFSMKLYFHFSLKIYDWTIVKFLNNSMFTKNTISFDCYIYFLYKLFKTVWRRGKKSFNQIKYSPFLLSLRLCLFHGVCSKKGFQMIVYAPSQILLLPHMMHGRKEALVCIALNIHKFIWLYRST